MDNMTSNQPYLLRAFCDWIVDNGLTPYIVVDADLPGVEVPRQFVKDGQIVLNISPSACVNLNVGLEGVAFQARFSGQPMQVFVPSIAVNAVYARENGAGTVFTRTPEELAEYEKSPHTDAGLPSAQLVKKLESVKLNEKADTKPEQSGKLTLAGESKASDAKKPLKESNGRSKKPSLKVIK
jgi:stringent starvation protein B